MELKFCKNCRKCCISDGYSNVILSQDDLEKLPKCDLEKIGNLQRIKINKKCQFLSKKGCTIPYENRPLDCKIFPLTFNFENNQIKIYLNDACPFIHKLPKNWIKNSKKELLQNLKRWSEKEIIAFSKIKPCGNLIKIENYTTLQKFTQTYLNFNF